jgi:hypothetical protein
MFDPRSGRTWGSSTFKCQKTSYVVTAKAICISLRYLSVAGPQRIAPRRQRQLLVVTGDWHCWETRVHGMCLFVRWEKCAENMGFSWLCGNARECASADWGIEVGDAFYRGTQFEAARVEENATGTAEQDLQPENASVS